MEVSPKQLTDEELVIQALLEQQYFGEIVIRYEAKLARYITRLGVRNPDDRDDVLQDIFVKIYRNLHGFDTGLSFSSWVYRIAHNEAISWYRKTKVRPEGHLVADSEPAMQLLATSTPGAEQLFDEEVNAAVLATALDDLDEKYRTVLILRFFEHKEYEEISDILKIPTGSVGTLVHRGKKHLHKLLDEQKLRI